MTSSVVVLISGRGSNLKALVERARGYSVTCVISNKSDAAGLTWAKERGIDVCVVAREDFSSLAEFKAGVLEAVSAAKADFVALAGFMVVLQPDFIGRFHGRLINIHPSLLPKYPGLHTHQRAIDAGERTHGCTVHFVDEGVDTGAVIAQGVVDITPGETAESLAEKTIAVEHRLYPWVMARLASGDIRCEGGGVVYSDLARSEASADGFILNCR